ncbi:hypothetical protein BGZ95_001347, partial [Linnemannia exigua]
IVAPSNQLSPSSYTMKLTFFQSTVLACSLVVLTMGTHAQEPCGTAIDTSCVMSENPIPCDISLESFCSESESQLDIDFDTMLAELPTEDPDAGATATPALRRSYPVFVKRDLIGDVKLYFKNYYRALGMIVKGDFGEGLFLQLKNSGSWCNHDSSIVKVIKKGIEMLSGGALTAICECLVPMVDQYESYNKLKKDASATDILKGCSNNLSKQIKDALKKAGSITKTGGKS